MPLDVLNAALRDSLVKFRNIKLGKHADEWIGEFKEEIKFEEELEGLFNWTKRVKPIKLWDTAIKSARGIADAFAKADDQVCNLPGSGVS